MSTVSVNIRGDQTWHMDGKLHRTDGPAMKWPMVVENGGSMVDGIV